MHDSAVSNREKANSYRLGIFGSYLELVVSYCERRLEGLRTDIRREDYWKQRQYGFSKLFRSVKVLSTILLQYAGSCGAS